MDEEKQAAALAESADKYYSKYRDYMDQLESSLVAEVRGFITPADIHALGSQLEATEEHFRMVEEEGNRNLLGKLPTVA